MKHLQLLWSARVAAILIAALGVLALVSVVVPQSSTLGAEYVETWVSLQPWLARPLIALGLDRVFSSWPYWLVSGLLCVNLIACTIRRVVKRRGVSTLGQPSGEHSRIHCAESADVIAHGLRAAFRFARVLNADDKGVVCAWGAWGFAGSVVMHAGLVLVVLAGVVTGLTRLESNLVLTEGQSVSDVAATYVETSRSPLMGDPFTGAEITLDRLEFDYAGSTITDARAFFSVADDGTSRFARARVNEPLRVGAKAFLLQDAGYAVGLRYTDAQGETFEAFVNLGEARPEGYYDTIDVGGWRLGLLAVPDATRLAEPADAKLNPVDPGLLVSAGAIAEDAPVTLAEAGLIRPGEVLQLPQGSLQLVDVRRWNRFNVRADGGLPVMYVALALIVIGTVVRVTDPDRVVRILLTGDGAVTVWSRARWGRVIAERAQDRVMRELAKLDPSATDSQEEDENER